MNVLIPYSWIKDYIKTNAGAEDAARVLSLHCFSVEKITKVNGEEVLEVEVTPNRSDALSVIGVARELSVVLPRSGFKCEWIGRKIEATHPTSKEDILEVKIQDENLVPRFCAVVLSNIKIGESPKKIRERLESVGIRALGNVIDVTNYMMISRGQPMHAFDYDKIEGHKMLVRESKEGETVITLDDVQRKLPKGVIIIEDGSGRLIDLCGIMGAKNSEVDENTKKVLLFVQAYNPVRIRKASMSLGHRTEAALRFEKGIDFEGILPALYESVEMLREMAGAEVTSELIDIKNTERKEKVIPVNYEKINKIAGIEIETEVVDSTLKDLGFERRNGSVIIPSWRYDDIEIPEDLAEEVIRVYGYHNLPGKLLSGEIPVTEMTTSYYLEDVVKDLLKHLGFFECYTYSCTKKGNVSEAAIKISNPLSEDLAYLKTSLLPELLEVLDKNQSYADKIKLFELGSVYFSNGKDLPMQDQFLGIVTKGIEKLDLKGVVEAVGDEMGIKDTLTYDIHDYGNTRFGVEIRFDTLVDKSINEKTYVPITNFNSIKENLTFMIPPGVLYPQVRSIISDSDERIYKLYFKDVYENALTFAIEYLDRGKQISSEDSQQIRKKIFEKLEKINVRLKV
jgi:phenylalanyl-tRNA synthetase beta chain